LQPYLVAHGDASRATLVSDRIFARRAWLDLTGKLPTPRELDAFDQESGRDKRQQLVRALLADRRAYTEHWLTFWNDALRNNYHGTGYIDGGRQQITGWLYRSLYENKHYGQFVRELVSPVPGSEGFAKGIVWRGVVNASQVPPMQAAQNIAQVFLGTNLKCASCHDSFVNYWKLKDAYALASVFSDGPLELHRCDKPIGENAEPGFIFPELGTIDGQLPRVERQSQLARLMTSPQNGRLARTVVNRLWAWFFGRGLVEPVDDMDQPPWHADLLDWLATDFVDHDYDLKHTMMVICTSAAYQRPSQDVSAPDDKAPWIFRGPLVKRLTAEQFLDAVSAVTRFERPAPSQMVESDGRSQGGQLNTAAAIVAEFDPRPDAVHELRAGSRWVWSHPEASKSDSGARIFLRKRIVLVGEPGRVAAVATCDNEFTLFLNGKKVVSSTDWKRPVPIDLTPYVKPGDNTIAVEASNRTDGRPGDGADQPPRATSAGFIFFAAAFGKRPDPTPHGDDAIDDPASSRSLFVAPQWTVGTDATWLWSKERTEGWEQPEFDEQGWEHVAELGPAPMEPWKLADALGNALLRQVPTGEVRSVLFGEDPLLRALGRPNREQVVTRRDSIATTLQGIELSNGATLDRILQQGVRYWLRRDLSAPELAKGIFEVAFGREPNPFEVEAAVEVLGTPPTEHGVADLLWAVIMQPEFQLVP
jgi:hypothetical protein